MKAEYDFSKGERGKFFREDAVFEYPIYLDENIIQDYEILAKKSNKDLNILLNEILKNNLELFKRVSL